MDSTQLMLFSVVSIVLMVHEVHGGSCFKFQGDGRVIFTGEDTNIGASAHFQLKFKTKKHTGIIYYAEGMYHRERVYDFEGVFLRDGYVNYFLFNPPEYSIGSTFGFHGRSRETLNDGKWHTVEWFRNRKSEVRSKGGKNEMTTQTGLIVDGKLVAVADGERVGVDIRPPYILGEDPHLDDRASKVIGSYEGNVMDFRELTTSHEFETERNMTGQVSHCIPGPDIEPV